MSSLRIVVKIPTGTYPELVADLDRVTPRERAERIRLLAMIGLKELHLIEPKNLQPNNMVDSQEQGLGARKTRTSNFIRSLTNNL
jgi:hypothetical protein